MRTPEQNFIKKLKQSSQNLAPVVIIGQKGLTDSILKEIDTNLKAHQLIKIKINHDDKTEIARISGEICQLLKATLVKHIGKMAVIWRETPKKAN